jgi:hypothetical protein
MHENKAYFHFMDRLDCFEIDLNQGHRNDLRTDLTLHKMQRTRKKGKQQSF